MSATNTTTTDHPSRTRNALMLTLAWLAVGAPLLWGVVQTIEKTLALFR
jgi:hypothetical protein